MAKEKLLTKEELEKINILQNKNLGNITQLGNLEFQIQKITEEKVNIIANIEQTEQEYQSELSKLEKKYGAIKVDLSTGKYTEVKETPEAVTE